MTPLEVEYNTYLENTLLNLNDTWKPLSSTYTQSGQQSTSNAVAGRPVSELSSSGGSE